MLKAVAASRSPIVLVQDGFPFVLPPSGTVAVTTGAITLGTALDLTYSSAYMYFPANTFTGSAAGFYYVTMSSTTAGLMYSNSYTSGIPAIPTSPTLVTTGAGAYTQTTSAVVAQSFTIPAGSMGTNGKVYTEVNGSCLNSGTGKTFIINFGGSSLGTTNSFALGSCILQNRLANMGSTAKQYYLNNNLLNGSGNVGNLTVNTAADVTQSISLQIGAATDWLVSKYVYIEIAR